MVACASLVRKREVQAAIAVCAVCVAENKEGEGALDATGHLVAGSLLVQSCWGWLTGPGVNG